MQLETRGPGASSQATGAMLGGVHRETIVSPTNRVNNPAQSMVDGMMFGRHVKSKNDQEDLGQYIVNVLRSKGIDVDAASLDTSGELARADEIGRSGKKDCAYIVHTDDPVSLWWQIHRTGEVGTWCSHEQLGSEGSAILKQRIEKQRIAREQETARRHEEAAKKAEALYKAATAGTGDHAYSQKKRVKFDPRVRRCEYMGHDCLVVPVYSKEGKLMSLQFIAGDKVFSGERDKTLMSGGRKAGCFCPVGPSFRDARCVVIGEGLSSVQPVVEATGLPGVVAIDKGNLRAVAEIVRGLAAPGADIIILADDDTPDPGGIEKAKEAAAAIGGRVALPAMGKKSDFWDVWSELGADAVKDRIDTAMTPIVEAVERGRVSPCSSAEDDKHATARARFPRTPFPWHVLPSNIERSLKQLARACATSETPLPGFAFCLIASAAGRKFSVSPKPSWTEPLIFWSGDIRSSGDGKTSAMRLMSKIVEDAQVKACIDAEEEEKKNSALATNDKKVVPVRPRAYFTTNMTLEGIQNDLVNHPTGGIVVLLNELSAFVNSHGEYKGGKGTDRESWLSLYDGSPVRVTRAKETRMIKGARVQVCGGIQPDIFRKIFSGGNGTFLEDGTIFRFLLTYEQSSFYPLTNESWSDEERDVWARTLNGVFHWANTNESMNAICSEDAQKVFVDWRNEVMSQKDDFPQLFSGFIPKAVSYAARLAGAIHLIHSMASGKYPSKILGVEDIQRGIIAAEFYLGQALDAVTLIAGNQNGGPADISPRAAIIAQALSGLQGDVDNGRLAVSYIQERFNQSLPPEQRVSNTKAFTAMLRKCGLQPLSGTHTANGKRSVTCLAWNEEVETFLKSSLFPLFPLQAHGWQGLAGAEENNSSSASSAQIEFDDSALQRTQSRENLPLQPETNGWQGFAEKTEKTEESSTRIMEVEL